MTTHEAIALQPDTKVKWRPPQGYVPHEDIGYARIEDTTKIRVVWEDQSSPDSIVLLTDSRMLAAVGIVDVQPDGD